MNFHTNHRVLFVSAGLIFLFLSLTIAVLPAFQMQKTQPLANIEARSDLAERGRALYVKEGCGTCHTQFVRDLEMDAPYGRGSVAGDYALENPPLLGTQRTGPDLANIGVRQPSDTWHLIHLYNPRAVVNASAMPGYPWYFQALDEAPENAVVVPVPPANAPANKIVIATEDALALVEYLKSLKQVEVK